MNWFHHIFIIGLLKSIDISNSWLIRTKKRTHRQRQSTCFHSNDQFVDNKLVQTMTISKQWAEIIVLMCLRLCLTTTSDVLITLSCTVRCSIAGWDHSFFRCQSDVMCSHQGVKKIKHERSKLRVKISFKLEACTAHGSIMKFTTNFTHAHYTRFRML